MLIIRPIAMEDLPALEALSHSAGFGLTSLPKDAKLLKRRIKASQRGFFNLSDEDPPRGETYLFVLEDTETKTIAGTSGVVSKVGGFDPFYGYRLETNIHASTQLHVRKTIRTLHLIEQHDGPCEVGSLFLSAQYRGGGNGRLLSLARFLFMADRLEYFDPVVISELRGVCDDAGRSPFWDAVGHHFFDIDYPSADYLSMVDKKFIADLMPRHPIYIPLLPFSAQAVIGKVQPETEPALAMLRDEGFELNGVVDIFDAGPVVKCELKQIRAIRESQTVVVERIAPIAEKPPGVAVGPLIISNTQQDFRACLGMIFNGTLAPEVAAALNVKVGDAVRFVAPRPTPIQETYDAPHSI
jgi:arginine N-succinyltransferase